MAMWEGIVHQVLKICEALCGRSEGSVETGQVGRQER